MKYNFFKFRQKDFDYFVKMIDATLTDKQVELLFKNCLTKCKATGAVNKNDLLEYFKSIGIRMKAINLAEIRK